VGDCETFHASNRTEILGTSDSLWEEVVHLNVAWGLPSWTSPPRDRFARWSRLSGLDGESNDPHLDTAAHERPF
jgi:hypothetical protein